MGRVAELERTVYEQAWQHPAYRQWSPGLEAVPRFVRLTKAAPPATVLDLGCGSGLAGRALADLGHGVTLVDQTNLGLDVHDLPFVCQCLWDPPRVTAEYAFCCDVLEHVPTEFVGLTLARLAESARIVYVEVSTEPDSLGVLVGETLHKTVRPFSWWLSTIAEVGAIFEAVDLLSRAAFVYMSHWSSRRQA